MENEEFKPITLNTKEEADQFTSTAVQERLKREREATDKKYEGWLSPDDLSKQTAEFKKSIDDLTKQADESAKTITDLTAKNKKYETSSLKTRVALSKGLAYEWAERLNGETEDDISKDADRIAKLIGSNHSKPAPMADPEQDPNDKDEKRAALRQTLRKLKGEE